MSVFISCSTRILIILVCSLLSDCRLLREPNKKQPHIILIVADDLGWNDVGFHGSIQIPTPNIDALAYNGVILNRHYVQPTCTPSRAALLTGKYPIRYGLQGLPIIAGEDKALPSTEKILPQYLKDLGYSTHLVGKWHLGANKKNHTPLKRGFDSHFGYWNGFISYRNSTHSTGLMIGKDARRGFQRAGDEMVDQYATDIFTNEANKVIKLCKNQEKPMFLMISHLAVHTGVPGPNILEVLNKTHNDIKFNYIENKERRLFAGMLTSLDESVGNIIESLDNNGMLEDSIVLFISDNGAPADDPIWGYGNSGSNWPLRGEKGAVLDGGVRGVAAIWSPWLKKKHRISENLFHITDWLPTLYTAAGGNFDDLGQIDGVDQWESLTETSKRMRSMALINIDETRGEEALIFNQWKVVKRKLNPNLAFHKFPSNEELCKKWVEWCRSSEIMDVFKSKGSRFLNKNRVICSDHFKSSDYIIWKGVGNKTLLFKGSILSVLTALPKVLSPHVIQCITNSQSQGNRTSDIVYFLKYSGEPGNIGPDYNMNAVAESPAGSRLSKINCLVSKTDCMDTLTTYDLFYNIRSQAKIDGKCTERITDPDPNGHYECFDSPCLFDIQRDPCEYQNIASRYPEALNMTVDMLLQFKKELMMQNYQEIDPEADPRFFDGYWDTWMEKSDGSISFGGRLHSRVILISMMCFYYYFII